MGAAYMPLKLDEKQKIKKNKGGVGGDPSRQQQQ